MYLFRAVLLLISLTSFALASFGDLIKVDKVKFKTVKDDWLMTEIDISVGRNNSTGSVGKKYVENSGIRLYLGFKNPKIEGGIDFYYSEVSIMLMEKGDKNTVRFYIPGKEIEMNRYNKPEYYYAEVTCGNQVLEPSSRAFSSRIKNRDSLYNFVDKAKASSVNNIGRLIPSYLTPYAIAGSDLDAPVYLRTQN